MSKMKKAILAVSLILSLLMVSQTMAWSPRNGNPPMNGIGMGWMSNLNLTQDQKAKLAELRQNMVKETMTVRSKLAALSIEFRTLFVRQDADEAKLKAMHSKMLTMQRRLQETLLTYRLAMRKILTPQQLSMLPLGCGFMGGLGSGFMGKGRGRHGGCGQGRFFAF